MNPTPTPPAFPVTFMRIIGDRLQLLAFIDPGRTPPVNYLGRRAIPELAPRRALHVVECRNGSVADDLAADSRDHAVIVRGPDVEPMTYRQALAERDEMR